MPKKLAKKVVKQTFELPSDVTKEAARQAGVIPRHEEEPELTKEQLEEKRKKERAESMKGAAQIEAELAEMVRKREKERRMRRKAQEKREKKEPVKPLVQPTSKPKRGSWLARHPRLSRLLGTKERGKVRVG